MRRSAALAVVVLIAGVSSGLSHAEGSRESPRVGSPSLTELEQEARLNRRLPAFQTDLERRLKFTPAEKALWASLARVQVLRGQFMGARISMRRAGLASLPGLPEPSDSVPTYAKQRATRLSAAADVARLAEERLAAGDDVGAQRLFARALSIDPMYGPAHLGIGEMHHRQGRMGLAEKAWRAMASNIQPRWRARLTLAELFLSHDMLAQAERTLSAPDAIPEHASPQLWQLRAAVATKQQDWRQAVKWWLQVNTAASSEEQGEYARLQILKAVQAAKPSEQPLLLDDLAGDAKPPPVSRVVLLARAYTALNAPDKGLALLEQLQAPADITVLRAALEIFAAGNRVAEALRWMNQFDWSAANVSAQRRAELLLEMARLERKRGDLEAAQVRVEEALAIDKDPRLWLEKAEISELRVAEDANNVTRAQEALALAEDHRDKRLLTDLRVRHGLFDKALQGTSDLASELGSSRSVLDVCAANHCLRELEEWFATRADPTEDADELHIAIASRWRQIMNTEANNDKPTASWEQVAEAVSAPLQRSFARGPAPSSVAIELAGQLGREEMIAPLARYVGSALASKQFDGAATAMLSLGALRASILFDTSVWKVAKSTDDRRVTRAWLWAAGAVGGGRGVSPPADLEGHLLDLLQNGPAEDKPFVIWALRAFNRAAVRDRLRSTFADPTAPQLAAAMALDSWQAMSPASETPPKAFALNAQLPALFGAAHSSAASSACALWRVALESANPTSEAALGILLRRPRAVSAAPTLRQLDAWPQTWVGGHSLSRTWDSEPIRLAMDRDSFWTTCRPTAMAGTGDPTATARALPRLALAWRAPMPVTIEAGGLAGLEKVALWGPACARAPAVFLKDAWGSPASAVEVERALDAAETAGCGLDRTISWLTSVVRGATTAAGKRRNDMCQRLSSTSQENAGKQAGLRALFGQSCL